MDAETLLEMFCDETVYTFERSGKHSSFSFGGPIEATQRFSGLPMGVRPLHMVARLYLGQIPEIRDRHRVFDLPLLYGLNYEGCDLTYRLKPSGWIEILELDPPVSSEDFPYANYPPLLPYVPLKLSGFRRCPYAEFAEEITNLTGEQPAELVVVVPPPATIGVFLWGREGDASDVTIVFECDLAERTIKAYNRFLT